MENKIYDTIIVGLGPAGISAGIYAARYRLNTLIIGLENGGMVAKTHLIDNYPGFPNISGEELSKKLLEHVKQYENCEIVSGNINTMQKINNEVSISTEDGRIFKGKSLILALGTERKRADIIGEKEFFGKGVSYCTVCDGMFYKDKVTTIIGSGDSALGGALHLSNIAKKTYLIIRKNEFSAKDKELVQKVESNANIEILKNTEVKEIRGDDKIRSIIIEKTNTNTNEKEDYEMNIDGFFIEIGSIPQAILLQTLGLDIDEKGYIKIDKECKTNIDGVYAAGDITTGFSDLKQIVVAEAMGAVAATSVRKFLF